MKINLIKIKSFFKKLPLFLGKKAFLVFIFSFAVSLIFGGFLFYKYSVLAQKKEIVVPVDKNILFKEKDYQSVLNAWQVREKKFNEAEFKVYTDIFQDIP